MRGIQTVYACCADYLCCGCVTAEGANPKLDPYAEDFDLPAASPYSEPVNASRRLQSPSPPESHNTAVSGAAYVPPQNVPVVQRAKFNPPAKSTVACGNSHMHLQPTYPMPLSQLSSPQHQEMPRVVKVRLLKSGVESTMSRSAEQSSPNLGSQARLGDATTQKPRTSALSAVSLSMKVKARPSSASEPQTATSLQLVPLAARNMMPPEFHGKPPTIVYMDGSTYWGETKENMRHGLGLWTNAEITYCGEWKDDRQEGPGEQTWADGRRYKGQFSRGCFHGIGKMTWVYEDGEMYYQGEYKEDKKSGHGSFVWADGRQYCGNWLDGKRHGSGVFTSPAGEVTRGVWDKDQVVSIEGVDDEQTSDASPSINADDKS